MNNNETLNLNQEREFQQNLAALAKEEEPIADLWPAIKSKIDNPEVIYYTPKWIPWAIAASLFISVGSVSFSWHNLQQAKLASKQMDVAERPLYDFNQRQVRFIEESYQAARVGLLATIGGTNSTIDQQVLSEIKNNLVDVEYAAILIKAAIKRQPENNKLPLLLKTTYEQELDVLTRLARLENSI